MKSVETLNAALADRYRIEAVLGHGGMATVYRACDLRHGRDVAIKVLRDDVAVSLGAERFLAEIRTTARLSHPHILPLHDSGEANGFLFYVMPLVEGESLRERLNREARLSVDEALRLAREVGDALAYAHSHEVIHRDIKPENILLQGGHPLLSDFGIARGQPAEGSERLTSVGLALGTPAYMSPEQAAGEREVDARSDIYSLACVLYEMLTGEAPFTGANADAILVQRFTQVAPRVTRKRASVPRGVEAAIAVAMSRAPEERQASMERFVQALAANLVSSGENEQSIAVLPFTSMSGDPEGEYFSDGIAEEIINALTQLKGLRVAARTSAFSFKGRNVDLRAIGDQLGVRTVLEGSVRRAGNRLRITAQLINVVDGYHLWSERYDRDATDVFAIQDEIARAIASKLEVSISQRSGEHLVKRATDNLAAYEAFLKGRALEMERGPALVTAVECFEHALELDPLYTAAHAELAKTLLLLALWGMRSPRATHERARAAAAQALRCEDPSASAWVAEALVAFLVDHDRAAAAVAWERAVQHDPLDVEARALRGTYDFGYVRGQFDDAIRELEIALNADPLNVSTRGHLSLILAFARRFDEAEAEARRAIDIGPRVFYAHWTLVHAYIVAGRFKEAVASSQRMLSIFGRHPWPMMGLAYASGMSGDCPTAIAILDELRARARTTWVQGSVLALSAMGSRYDAEALAYMTDAVREKDPLFTLWMSHWPPMDSIRATPGWAEVLRLAGWTEPFRG